MTININAAQILKGLYILSWIIFLGLCIETGGIIFNTVYAMYKPIVAGHFWKGADLSAIYSADKVQFLTQVFFMITVAVFKTLMFWLIIRLFHHKKFNIARPFNAEVTSIVFNIAHLCLGAGIFSIWGSHNLAWSASKGIPMPPAEVLGLSSGDVWLFMAVVLYVIGQVFRKGTEIQTENDYTV